MRKIERGKVPVYGFSYLKDGRRERQLVGYVCMSEENVPLLETKVGRKIVTTNLSVLYDQLHKSPTM